MDFQLIFEFFKSKRPFLLLANGIFIVISWMVFMGWYQLYDLSPYGVESIYTMKGALWLYGTLTTLLLGIVFWLGSVHSPLSSRHPARQFAMGTYVAFKNFIYIVVVLVLIGGGPRLKYYQMRAEAIGYGNTFQEMSYYEQRTWARVARDILGILESTSEYSEDADTAPTIGVVPSIDLDLDSDGDSSSSKSSTSSDSDSSGWGDLLGPAGLALLSIVTFLLTGSLILLFVGMIICSFAFPHFWLVAMLCLGIGMILLSAFDIIDGPRV